MPNQKSDLSSFLKSPVVRRVITCMVNSLTDLDDQVRPESVEAVPLVLRPPLLALVLERLIERLRHGSPALHSRATESLAGLGPLAEFAVVQDLVRGRNTLLRHSLVGVLADLGQYLDAGDRLRLVQVLEKMIDTDQSCLLAFACVNAIAALRQGANDDGPGSAAANASPRGPAGVPCATDLRGSSPAPLG